MDAPNYGRQVLIDQNYAFTGGLSAPGANVRGGVFGPQGRGGGIFDGSTQMSGLGKALGSLGQYENMPWGEYSTDTLGAQQAVNFVLRANDYCPIVEDGKLGPATCGALSLAQNLPGVQAGPPGTLGPPGPPEHCRSMTTPRLVEQGCAQAAPKPPPGGAAPPDDTVTYAPVRRGGFGTVGFLLLATAVAGGGVYFATRKK